MVKNKKTKPAAPIIKKHVPVQDKDRADILNQHNAVLKKHSDHLNTAVQELQEQFKKEKRKDRKK